MELDGNVGYLDRMSVMFRSRHLHVLSKVEYLDRNVVFCFLFQKCISVYFEHADILKILTF